MDEENVNVDLKFTEISEALQHCQSYVTSYCVDSVEANKSLLTEAFEEKNKAIEACEEAGKIVKEGETEPTDDELTKICTIKDIYVLAYFIMSQYFTNQEIINKFKERFLDLQYDGEKEEEFKSKIKKFTFDITIVPGFGQASLNPTAAPTLSPPTAAPTLSPPAAAPTLSPTAAAPVTLGPRTADKAKELLETAVKKLCDLTTTTSTPLTNLLKSEKVVSFIETKFDYNEYYEFMGYLTPEKIEKLTPIEKKMLAVSKTFMDYIGDENIFQKVKEFIAKITYKGKTDGTYVFTLHDIVGYATPVSKLNKNSESYELSDYCKARDVFIRILQFIKEQYTTQQISVDFVYPPLSGLKKSSTTCNPVYGKADMPLSSVQLGQTWSKVTSIAAGGGSKSRRRHRRHARKTRRGRSRKPKAKSKTHRRRRHSRVRKHKKNTYTRRR